jgi:hypothetical protein
VTNNNNNASPQNRTNVVVLRRPQVTDSVRAFNALTHRLVLEQYCAGTLLEPVLSRPAGGRGAVAMSGFDGPLAGTHGRYILRSKVERLADLQEAA